jgi:hypothetical protein
MMENYKVKFTQTGPDTFTLVQKFGENKVVNHVVLDQEKDYEVQPGVFKRALVTQSGSIAYLWLSADKESPIKEEHKITFNDNGMTFVRFPYVDQISFFALTNSCWCRIRPRGRAALP